MFFAILAEKIVDIIFLNHTIIADKTTQHLDRGSNKTEVRLFCQNPESYKYEGQNRYGTAATILCEHYEKTEVTGLIE